MSRENVEVVRSLFEAFRRQDVSAAIGYLDPAVEWCENPRGGFGDLRSVYHGHAGFRDWVAHVGEAWEEAWAEPEEFIDGTGSRVICAYRLHARGRESEVPVVSQTMYDLYTVRDGKIVERRLYGVRRQALEAVGLRE
jgi:ketosteroid isomerase-like protein